LSLRQEIVNSFHIKFPFVSHLVDKNLKFQITCHATEKHQVRMKYIFWGHILELNPHICKNVNTFIIGAHLLQLRKKNRTKIYGTHLKADIQ